MMQFPNILKNLTPPNHTTDTKVYTLFSSLQDYTMATRARIGIQLQDDSILSVYHHWDGYPTWLGRILETHYNTKEKVSELIDGGDMSSAWTNCGWNNETRPETGAMYYSERGEICPPRLDESITDFINNGEEFGYIFQDGAWFCYDTKTWSDTFAQVIDIPDGALAA